MLYIAVVAYNFELSCRAIRILAENDANTEIKTIRKDVIEMSDNTKYKAFSNYNHVRGHYIDQLVIVDDFRWNVHMQQEELISWIKYRMMHSCVPKEFQIQEYEY